MTHRYNLNLLPHAESVNRRGPEPGKTLLIILLVGRDFLFPFINIYYSHAITLRRTRDIIVKRVNFSRDLCERGWEGIRSCRLSFLCGGFYRHLSRRRYSDGVAGELTVPPLNRGSDFVPVSFGSLRAPLITPSAKGLMKILS